MKMKINNKKFELSRDSMLKLISLLVAIFLFLYVRGEVDPEMTLVFKDVPIRYENLAELKSSDLSLITPPDEKVDVSIKVKQSSVSKINRDDIDASINLGGYYTGNFDIPINIKISGDAVVEKKNPERLSVRIEENIVKEIPVDIQTTGILPEGYIIGDLKAKEEVKVKGATSAIDSIDKIIALYDVSDRTSSSVLVSEVIAYDKEGNAIKSVSIEPRQLQIEVPILKTKSVPLTLNIVGNNDGKIDTSKFMVVPNTVAITGNASVIDGITEIKTQEISADKILQGQLPIDIILPQGVLQLDKDIRYVASNGPIDLKKQTFVFDSNEIKIIKNKDEDFDVSFTDLDKVTLVVAPKDPLSKETIKKEDIDLSIDVSNFVEGKSLVKLKIKLPNKFKLIDSDQSDIEVKINGKGIF